MISVCIATYNGEKYIEHQLRSILPQLGETDEIIISDDGSTDNTMTIVSSIDDPRIRWIVNSGQHGVNHNFENALIHSRGEYIFLADQDDEWMDDKVAVCMKSLKGNVCVIHDCHITDGSLRQTGRSMFEEIKARPGIIHNIIRNGYTGCCMAFHRSILKKALPFPSTSLFFHDQWLGLIAGYCGKVAFIPDKEILFRRHDGISSSAGRKSANSLLEKLALRIKLIYCLFGRIIRKD